MLRRTFIALVTLSASPWACGENGSTQPPDAATDAVADVEAPNDGAATEGSSNDGAPPDCAPAPTSPTIANVKDALYGAKGDGATDDTASIQKAVDAVAGTGGTVFVPSGNYRINALVSVLLKSNMTLQLDPGAVLAAIPNASANYDVVKISGATNVNVRGGTIQGERSMHTGTGGEWGMCLSIEASQHVAVQDVTAKDCWGDGFYISNTPSDVVMCRVVSDHNRRQGMSVTSVTGLVVRDSTFQNTTGTLPEDGIDIEPNPGETVSNATFSRCTLANNAGFGFELGVPLANTGKAFITNVVLDANTASGNGVNTLSASPRAGFETSNTSGHTIKDNTSKSNLGDGILLRDNANGVSVTGNTVTGNGQNGIEEYSCSGNTITGNTVTGNKGHGIISSSCDGGTIDANTVSGNGLSP